MSQNCPFCKIIKDAHPGIIIYQDEQVTAFHDIHPITPVHILIIPNQHIESINQTCPEHEAVLGHMAVIAKSLAQQNGVSQSGYRLVINTGPDAGQSVFHVHMHLLGGRRMPFHFKEYE